MKKREDFRPGSFPAVGLPLTIVSAALAGILASAAGAQVHIHRSLSVEDGLIHAQVLSICEDFSGFLWLGTADGVSRFDGLAFVSFQSDDGLPEGRVNAIYQAPGGAIFFGTDSGVGIYQQGRFVRPRADSGLGDMAVNAITGGFNGNIFFGTTQGVVELHPDGRSTPLPKGKPLLGKEILALRLARDGTLYAGLEGGLLIYREGRLVGTLTRKDGLPGTAVLSIGEGRDRTIFLGTQQGLALYRNGRLVEPGKSAGPHEAVLAVAEGADGTLYLGTRFAGALLRRLGEPFASLTTENGQTWERVNAVYPSRSGALFFGTDRGVGVYHPGLPISSWTTGSGLPGGPVWSIAQDAGGSIYVGTGRGLARFAEGRWHPLAPPDGKTETIFALHVDASGKLYAGNGRGELKLYDGGRLVQILRGEDGPRGAVYAIHTDPDGALYLGTPGGLRRLRKGRVETLWSRRSEDGTVEAIAGAPGGGLYLGTRNGLILYREGVARLWTRRDGLADDHVRSLKSGRDGSLFIGTSRGLSILRNGRLRTIDRRDGLTNEVIYCILEDQAGRVYLSTRRGIDVIDPAASPVKIRTFRRADGLAGDQGSHACYQDRAGRLWFGSQTGLSVVDPTLERPRRDPPRIHFSGLELAGEEVPLPLPGQALHLAGHQKHLTLSFIAIDLAMPHQVLYRYRIADLDAAWSETNARSIHFSRLAPGNHTFEVQAANESGVWGELARLRFTVPAPFYRRLWFLLLISLTLGSAVAAALAYRVRHLLAIERLRIAIAADLHDQIGSGLTEITIHCEAAARAGGPTRPVAELARVAGIARELTGRMSDVVWLINPRRDSLHQLFLRLKDSYSELFSQTGVLFRTVDLSAFERVRLPVSYRQNLYLIFKEALHNALLHGDCREIELDVVVHARRLDVTLEDDGMGFDFKTIGEEGNGLDNMRRRAAAIGGQAGA